MYDIIFLVGFFGALIQLVAYALNLRDRLHHHSMTYLLANVVGCMMTVSYAFITWDIPFLMLEVSWGAFALHKLYEVKLKRGRSKRSR